MKPESDKGKLIGNDWSKKQLHVMQLMATTDLDLNHISEESKASLASIYRWRQNPAFLEEVLAIARNDLRSYIPQVYQRLISKATAGEYCFVKLFLEHLEKLEELKLKATNASITFTWEVPDCTPMQ